MVLSLGVIVGVVAVLLAVVPRSNEIPQAAVDASSAVQAARQRLDVPVPGPQGLPSTWVATSTRLTDGTDGVFTFDLVYRTPSGWVALRFGVHPTQAWEDVQVTDGPQGTSQTIDGQAWVHRDRPDRGTTSLVLRQPQTTTIATGHADPADVTALAASLVWK